MAADVVKITERVQTIIAKQLTITKDEVLPTARFVEDLDADSLDVVELVMSLEEEFDTEIPDGAAAEIKTVQELLNYILENTEE